MKSNFKLYGCCETVTIAPSEYSDGAILLNFPLSFDTTSKPIVYIDATIKDSIGLLSLPSITNRIRHAYTEAFNSDTLKIFLNLTYFPHARQDRYTGDNAFTLKYSVIPLLQIADVDQIVVEDPHSSVCIDLLRELDIPVQVLTQKQALNSYGILDNLIAENYTTVISPDNGAIERASEMAKALKVESVNSLNKSRNPDTGRLSFEPYIPKEGEDLSKVIMFDDIGDGCWTHILAAQALREAGAKHITLVITHGILSKGVDHLHPAIDTLIVVNDWRKKTFEVQTLNSF